MWLKTNVIKINIFILVAALGSPLFFSSRATATEDHLWNHPEWLRLNHYVKSLTGKYQSKIQGPYFLAPDGKQNPESEFKTLVEKLKNAPLETKEKIQCRYPARMDFLNRYYFSKENQIPLCASKHDWIQKLGATRISLIFASGYLGSASSTYGHTFLKFIDESNQGGRELVDYAVNFSARTGETQGALYALYGLFGYFPGAYTLLPYHQLIKEYTNLEGRDLWEYELSLTPEEVRRLILYLLEMEGTYIDYYFVDDNCSFHILWALQIARPSLNFIDPEEAYVIPLETVKLVERIPGLISQTNYRPSLRTIFENQYSLLTDQEKKDLQKYTRGENHLEQMSTKTLEATQTHASIQEASDPIAWKEKSYALALARAQRPDQTEYRKSEKENPVFSSDTGLLGVQLSSSSEISSQSFRVGFAYQDFLTRQSQWQELQVMNFQLQYAHHQLKLTDWALLKVRSTDHWASPLGKPSWGFFVGGKDSLSYFEGQWGLGHDLSHNRLLVLPTVAIHNRDRKGLFFGGTEFLALSNITKKLRGLAQLKSLSSNLGWSHQTSLELSQDLSDQNEVRLQVLNLSENEKTETQINFSLYLHFLFD